MKHVLQKVNDARKALGLAPIEELPKGLRGISTMCPLSKALSAKCVGARDAWFYSPDEADAVAKAWGTKRETLTQMITAVVLPRTLARFVVDFDRGKHPEYDEMQS